MVTDLFLLILSIAMLVGGAEILVRSASFLALRVGISPFVIGLTILGFGTSAPELAASIASARAGHGEIAVGNVIGSNIMNVALVLGVTASLVPIPVIRTVVQREVLVTIAASFTPYLALATGGVVTRLQGLAMVAGLFAFLGWVAVQARKEPASATDADGDLEKAEGGAAKVMGSLAFIVAGIGILVVGAALLVDAATGIARALGVSELIIGLTIVAGGTSAPELATSLVAVWKGRSDLGVGNILGSCVFNLLGILGITAMVTPLTIPPEAFRFDLPVMIATAIACLPIMLTGHRISRLEGVLLAIGFLAYTVLLFVGWPYPADRGSTTPQDTAVSIQAPPSTSSPS